MRKNEPVTHVMTRNPITVNLANKPSDVRRVFAENSFHHLPVVDGTKLVGMISSSDVLRFFADAWGTDARALDAAIDAQFTVEQWMAASPRKLAEHDTVRDAVRALSAGDIHAVPVQDAGGHLLGIVTSTDLLRYLLEQLS
ncbi:MAG: CBS domain-containing protein [Myxococcales bacterium]|nr:CBS domain-containing protein [Myxococcales bacterium]MCB9519877.1 CBS domain-containing protein [Myxococcales bacterium]MCB9533216.1 CBS domain-containing protein [Myxococcales bacterium]